MSKQTSIHQFFRSVNSQKRLPENPKKKKKINPTTPTTPVKSKSVNMQPANVVDLTIGSDEANFVPLQIIRRRHPSTVKSEILDTQDNDSVQLEQTVHRSPKRSASASRNIGEITPRKKAQRNRSMSVIKHMRHRSPGKLFRDNAIDTDLVSAMIDNLNLSRQGILPTNNFKLEELYMENKFEIDLANHAVEQVAPAYDINRVNIPQEKHAEHLFYILTNVFSNPINCGYFNDDELDMVFSIIALSEKAQMLLARLIKRQYRWQPISTYKYPEIGIDLEPYFDELEKSKLVTSDTENENLETLVAMLSADKLHNVFRQSKIPWKSKTKELAQAVLLKNTSTKALFPGMESPVAVLRKTVLNTLGRCITLPDRVINLFERMIVLFMPTAEPKITLSEIFFKLTMVKEGTLIFPVIPTELYPIFQDREHLIRYTGWWQKYKQVIETPRTDEVQWRSLIPIGREAYSRFVDLETNVTGQGNTSLPKHLQRFLEPYLCIKIVTSCLELFKRERALIPEVITMINTLVKQENWMQNKKSKWYDELALIYTSHRKDIVSAAKMIIQGLAFPKISETGRLALVKRASALANRKSGLPADIKSQLAGFVDQKLLSKVPAISVSANMIQGNQPGRKSTWAIDMGAGDKGFCKVEHRALLHYKTMGYPEGWHCEGSLPITLFALLLWDEIYSLSVPGAFLDPYQEAPLDLFTSQFYTNRKDQIDKRFKQVEGLTGQELSDVIETSFEIRKHYTSLLPTSSLITGSQLKDIVRCMGTTGVLGICKRLTLNFVVWRSGFPDLVVWNRHDGNIKIVEVKGPKDRLSDKQTLWMQYLLELGVPTEICNITSGLGGAR